MGHDLTILPNCVVRIGAFNIEGGQRSTDLEATGDFLGRYMARWGVHLAGLSEVPLRHGTGPALRRGLAPYGFTCSVPPGLSQELGATLVYPVAYELKGIAAAEGGAPRAG